MEPCQYFIFIKNLKSGEIYPKMLMNDLCDHIVFDDSNGVYYSRKNTMGRASLIVYMNLNELVEQVIFEENDPQYEIKIEKSGNSEYLIIKSNKISGDKQNQILFRKVNEVDQQFEVIFKKEENEFFNAKFATNEIYYLKKDNKKIFKRIFNNQQTPLLQQQQQNVQLTFDEIHNQLKMIEQQEKISVMNQSNNQSQEITDPQQIQSQSNNINISNQNDLIDQSLQQQDDQLFYELEKNETLQFFEVFQHYIVLSLEQNNQSYLKVYNQKLQKMHKLSFKEESFSLSQESPQRYSSQYFNFSLKQPHLPNRVMSYNMGLRQLDLLQTDTYNFFSPEDYTIEKIFAESRDGTQIPMTFFYNKKVLGAENPVILHLKSQLEQKSQFEFQPEILSLLDRGFIYCYPHIRGTTDINNQWFDQGANLKRLTNVSDLIDCAKFLIEKEVSQRILGFSSSQLGGLTLATAILSEPTLFRAAVIDNGIFNVPDFIQKYSNNEQVQKFFGNYEQHDILEYQMEYSPQFILEKFSIQLDNLLLTSDANNEFTYQSRQFIAKLRENKENVEVYYKEFFENKYPLEKTALQYAFLINRAFYIQ